MRVTGLHVWVAALLGMVGASIVVSTQGQPPVLLFGSVTTSAPSYTNGTTNQLSLNTAGGLRTTPVDTSGNQVFGTVATPADDTALSAMGKVFAVLGCYDGTNIDLCRSSAVLEDTAASNGDPGTPLFGARRNEAASSTATDAEYGTLNFDALGLLWTRTLDPCTGIAWTHISLSLTADTALLTTGGASNRTYICDGFLFSNSAETVNLWEGTGTACGTNTNDIMGDGTEGNGISLLANEGFRIPRIRTPTLDRDVCLRVVTGNRVIVALDYVQAP